ncbi:MAG: DUF4271 domain-containing protein [Bacteroidales bacterium]|nr:DUF4271 domain-containing protein [Bacteroidales bacterium]
MAGEEIFRSGTLEMSTQPWDGLAQAPLWTDLTVNRVLCLVAIVLMVANLLDYFRLVPSLLFCFNRSRGAEALEHSLGLARVRNLSGIVYGLPFCLILDRFGVVRPEFWDRIPPTWQAPAMIGLMAAFMFVRDLCYLLFRPRRVYGEPYATLRHNVFNYLLLLVPLLLVTVAVITAFRLSPELAVYILAGEIALAWLFGLTRSAQILHNRCSGLSTFLYLCALELLPAAILVAVVLLF